MNNPLSSDPRHALYPHPPGCTGYRLHEMLATEALLREPPVVITRQDYLARFDRRNLLNAREWSAADARRAAGGLLDGLGSGSSAAPATRCAAILGASTLKACGLPRPPQWGAWRSYQWTPDLELRYCLLPHPSGRCREYNDPMMRRLAGLTLLNMYELGDAS
jgi:hypothetical protein